MLASLFKLPLNFWAFSSSLFKSQNPMATSFYAQELQRALKEQGTAIHSFRIVEATSMQAGANVQLLEGNSVDIKLTQQGFEVENNGSQIHETLENLLRLNSPLYRKKQSQALFDALNKLS